MPSQPYWERLVDDIAERIRNGELRSGDQLPSITVLTERYRVSRSTVKIALLMLRRAGLIYGEQGRGTYVV